MPIQNPALFLNELYTTPTPDAITTIFHGYFAKSLVPSAPLVPWEELYTWSPLQLLALATAPSPDAVSIMHHAYSRRSITDFGQLKGDSGGGADSTEPAFTTTLVII